MSVAFYPLFYTTSLSENCSNDLNDGEAAYRFTFLQSGTSDQIRYAISELTGFIIVSLSFLLLASQIIVIMPLFAYFTKVILMKFIRRDIVVISFTFDIFI